MAYAKARSFSEEKISSRRIDTSETSSRIASVNWAQDFYAGVCLPDERLKTRLIRISAAIAARPADSFPQACLNWAEAKGAYRLIENERVSAEALQQPASNRAARECAGQEIVLAIQDTTVLSFSSARQAEGLGPVNDDPNARGMFFHPVLALREDGFPLGLLHQQTWCRDLKTRKHDTYLSCIPIEKKESFKWIRGIREARQAIHANLPAEARPRLIHVFDREGDVFEVFEEIAKAPDGTVIRSHHNRRVITAEGCGRMIQDWVRAAPLLGTALIDVPRKQGRAARQATIEARTRKVTLTPQNSKGSTDRWLELTLVEVWESDSPEGVVPLHWLLWTTEPVENLQGALRIISIYKMRWKIEEFNLILKGGCRIEQLQFGRADRLTKVLALYAPIALRILQLRDLSRQTPEAPCTIVLSHNEWRALWTYIHQKPPVVTLSPPTLEQATKWIGRLGGHLGRKNDGMPGVRALWRGWRDLDLLTGMYALSTPPPSS